ncbi:LOW QUALITY PROTEIN: lymphocyte antigen 75 [Brachyhypopomus gauderio]|uniref:LOW QUALITY PROTEIN: lymphocyte antigen 75 n=1 Tax=Brachyhypopomus gauderio TaxID=698409 RepID=UPI00404254A6
MNPTGQAVLYSLLCLLCGETTVRFGSNATRIITGDDAFAIQHEEKGKCLQVQQGSLTLGECSEEPTRPWKWGAGHQLFHTGSSACLGLDVPTKTFILTDCFSVPLLGWDCLDGSIITIHQMKLGTTGNGSVVAKRDAPDSWKRGGTSETICSQPYQAMHTTGGNSNGAPCRFPFLYNGTWHHNCVATANATRPVEWCSTTDNYDQDQMWGDCLKYEEGCGALWDGPVNGSCILVVSVAMVTWHEARDACRSQGGDLFSVSSAQDLQISTAWRDKLPDKLWIGLNHLDWVQGWQWSDGSGLAYVPWEAGSPWDSSMLQAPECGVLNVDLNYGVEGCESKLPYICEKRENSNQSEAPAKVVSKPTQCEAGWVPWNRYCYRLYGTKAGEQKPYEGAQQACVQDGAQLASIHGLEDIEMINTQFEGDTRSIWIGLKADSNTNLFRWEDGTEVSFTYWARTQPLLLTPDRNSCVVSYEMDHTWSVVSCNISNSFLCKKKGTVNESVPDADCPQGKDWRRHRNSCYRVDTQEVSYKNSCKLTINDRFEQTFINSLLKEHISSKPLYFWTGLQDSKGIGEYQWFNQTERVAFTNWRWQEPASTGGCAVLSTAIPLGHWSVKNCTVFKAGSICKRPITSEPPAPPEPTPDLHTPCAPGWVTRDGNKYCYKVFHEERLSRKRSWEEAEHFCEELGAHLPSFTEEQEMSVLHGIMRDSISDDRFFWVGLSRRNPNSDNSWEWSDRRPVSMMIFPQEFHEDDEYSRDCAAFKTLKGSFMMSPLFWPYRLLQRLFYPSAFHCDAKLEWVCQIPRGKAPLNPEWYNPDGHHNSSVFIDGQEFWFVTSPKLSFEEASIYCSSNKSRLATPQTLNAALQLQQQLSEYAGYRDAHWWMDLREPGPLVPLRYSRLHFYNAVFLGRCTSFSSDSFMPDFQIKCAVKQPFVCEVLNVTSVETGIQAPHLPAKPCENGTYAFRDKCYTVLSNPQYINFKAANEECQSLRGTLLSIGDQAEQDFITSLLPGRPQKLWIGLKLRLHDTLWVDSSPVTYLNFNPLLHGQLRPMYINRFEQSGLELCAYMFNDAHSDMLGTWDYTSCSDEQHLAICQHYADKQQPANMTEYEFQANNRKFRVLLAKDGSNMTWYEALDLCKQSNMDLASVPDAYLQAVLTVHVNKVGRALWIGLFRKDEEQYHWIDHSHTVFSRWSPEVTEGRCVYLDTDGFWKATDCRSRLQGAFCLSPHDVHIKPSQNVTRCPHESKGPNWVPFRNSCYTFLLKSQRWQEQEKNNDQKTCEVLVGKGDVLTIRNEEENIFITKQLQPFKDLAAFVWLGMHKQDNQLKWFDKTNVQYSNWKSGRPNATMPFMAGLNLDGEWDLIQDERFFAPFKQRAVVVCKIEYDPKDEYRKSLVDVYSPPGYTFRVVGKKLNWYQALEECRSDGGHLASIHNETVNRDMALITKLDGFPLWIGLSRQDFSGWPYEWSDGTSLQFQPQGFVGTSSVSEEKCVYMDSKGSWYAVNCYAELEGAICYNTVSKHKASARFSNNCPMSDGQASWLQFNDHCYAIEMTLYNYSIYTMEHAKSVCEKLDPSSQLLTIQSMEENDFVTRHVAENPFITSRVWLGLSDISNGKAYSWIDGSVMEFSNWAHFQPQQGCAVLVSMNGTWSTTKCTESRSRVVCKAQAKSKGAPVALVFFIIVLLCLTAVVVFVVYKRTRQHFFSTVRYQRNFDEADSTSMIAETE